MITDIFDKNIVKILILFSITPGSKFTRKEIQDQTIILRDPEGKLFATIDDKLSLQFRGDQRSINLRTNSCEKVVQEFVRRI